MSLRDHIADILARRRPREEAPPGFRRAAVLLPLRTGIGAVHLAIAKSLNYSISDFKSWCRGCTVRESVGHEKRR